MISIRPRHRVEALSLQFNSSFMLYYYFRAVIYIWSFLLTPANYFIIISINKLNGATKGITARQNEKFNLSSKIILVFYFKTHNAIVDK